MKKSLLILIMSILTLITNAQVIREISVPSLSDIAIASFDQQGPVIYYNPGGMQQVGSLAASFFMAHEYGHHNLGHIILKLWNANNPYVQAWLDMNMENEADAYAVRYWIGQNNQAVIQSGANAMWTWNNGGDKTHAPSRLRANNIANLFFQLTGKSLFP